MHAAAPSGIPDEPGPLVGRRGRWWLAWGQQGRTRWPAVATVAAAIFIVLVGLPLVVLVWPPPLPSGPGGASGLDASGSTASRSLQFVNLANLFFWNLKQTAREVIKEEAAIAQIDPDRVDGAFAPLEPVRVDVDFCRQPTTIVIVAVEQTIHTIKSIHVCIPFLNRSWRRSALRATCGPSTRPGTACGCAGPAPAWRTTRSACGKPFTAHNATWSCSCPAAAINWSGR